MIIVVVPTSLVEASAMIGNDEFAKICKLAKIRIEKEDLESFITKFNNVLDWVAELEKIDVSGIQLIDEDEVVGTVEAKDESVEWNHRDSIFANTKHKRFDMFSVPKVIE
jgi:aspartyl-tRNA(Asn)/glutamyl-tRNA(Gln) amidotransferase subunit C